MAYLTLIETAEKLRVSKHTIQAWMSPSSPNHKPEFAAIARHAGRKTVFTEEDIELWLNQRKGSMYASDLTEVSAYWLERFVEYRGALSGVLKSPTINKNNNSIAFTGGKLGIDAETLCLWLTNDKYASSALKIIEKAESLMISTSLVYWLLTHLSQNKRFYSSMKTFLLESNIFEIASFNDSALRLALDLNALNLNDTSLRSSELAFKSYVSCIANGATAFLCNNEKLYAINGLKLVGLRA